jgi:outer membrane autotransporter protein
MRHPASSLMCAPRSRAEQSSLILASVGSLLKKSLLAISVAVSAMGLVQPHVRAAQSEIVDQTLETSGFGMHAVYAVGGDSLIATNVDASTLGNNAFGAYAGGKNSHVTYNSGSITTAGIASHGLAAMSGGRIDATSLTIHTVGDFARGAFVAGGVDDTLSELTLRHSSIRTEGVGAAGLAVTDNAQLGAYQTRISTTGEGAQALHVFNGGTLDIQASDVHTRGVDAFAAVVNDGGLLVDASRLSTERSTAFKLRNAYVHLSNGTQVDAGNGVLVEVMDDPDLQPASKLILDGNVLAQGDIRSATRNPMPRSLDLQLINQSRWIGATDAVAQVSMGAGSRWDMTADSTVSTLAMRGATVKFGPAVGGVYKTLVVDGDLSGSGRFEMNSDLSRNQSDLLRVNGQISGSHTLVVEDTGYEPTLAGDGVRLVNGHGGAGQFALLGEHIDAGAFRYNLKQQGNDWYLVNVASVPEEPSPPPVPPAVEEPLVTPMPDESVKPLRPATVMPEQLSKGANAAIAAHTASATMWSAQMNALVKRLGELRMGEDEGGIWTRAIGKRFDVSEQSSRSYTQDVSGVELGADKAIALDSGKVYIGGMVGTAKSDLNFGEGATGDIESRMAGVYATYLHDSGVYVDSVLKYSHFDNEIKMSTNLGTPVKGSYGTHGVGADIEVGKHIKLKDGWFVEPQLEVTATRTQGASYTTSNGLKVKSDDMDSLQSRVGALFGRSLQLDNGMNVQPYVKASYINEHAGSSKVSVNGNTLDAELPGDRVELGFGGVVQVSQKSKVSLDAEYAKGNDIKQPWGVTVGYRYLW